MGVIIVEVVKRRITASRSCSHGGGRESVEPRSEVSCRACRVLSGGEPRKECLGRRLGWKVGGELRVYQGQPRQGRRQKVQRARCGLQRRLNDNERVLKELQAAKGFWTPTMEVLMRGWVQGRACKV